MPSLADIQRTNLAVLAISGLLLLAFVSPAASIGCVIGAGVVIANLFILGLLGRVLSAMAAGGSGARLVAVAIPLKLILIAGLVYLVFAVVRVDPIGFAIGVSTQLIAILFETVRRWRRLKRTSEGAEQGIAESGQSA